MSRTRPRVLDDVALYTRIYRQMLLIRGFEDLVQSLFLKGEVYGIVFAKSLDDPNTGYALTVDEARPVIQSGRAAVRGVDTDSCA